MENSEFFMKRALQLAEKGRGYTSPNPMVGAVLVRDGRVIGEGYHQKYGQKHAEVLAIESATESVEGATLYCNLEPCCHNIPEKNTPPCTQRIISEKIGKVVIATIDPNPHVNGNGVAELRQAGIEVQSGVLSEPAKYLNEIYFKFIQTRRPFVHLKIAQSLDGRIATRCGDSKWITDEDARREVHRLRQQYDAVLVGVNTVLKDDPALTNRSADGRQPLRIILDSGLKVPLHAQVVSDPFREHTVLFTTENHAAERRKELERAGVRIEVVPPDAEGRTRLEEVLERLSRDPVSSLLVEGGGSVFTAFVRAGLYDKITFMIAPILIGEGTPAVGDLGISKIQQAVRFDKLFQRELNGQCILQGYRSLKDTFGILEKAM